MTVYTAAPIVEAVLQIVLEKPVSPSDFRKFIRRVGKLYKNHRTLPLVEAKIDFEKRDVNFIDSGAQERFTSSDEADIAVFQPQVFSWSRLAPYQSWAPFLERFSRDFEIFHDLAGYTKVQRVGLRFINRIDVPMTENVGRFEDYLKINLNLPEKWELIQNYGWRFERLFQELGFRAIVQSAIVDPVMPDFSAVLLDIEVATIDEVESKFQQLKSTLEKLRQLKNEIFENSITDLARRRFANQ